MYLKTLEIPIYNYTYHIIVIHNIKQDMDTLNNLTQISNIHIKNVLKWKKINAMTAIAIIPKNSKEIATVFFTENLYLNKDNQLPNTNQISELNSQIAHEALHLTTFIMKNIGCKLSTNSEESYAYLLSYIVNETSKFIFQLITDPQSIKKI